MGPEYLIHRAEILQQCLRRAEIGICLLLYAHIYFIKWMAQTYRWPMLYTFTALTSVLHKLLTNNTFFISWWVRS